MKKDFSIHEWQAKHLRENLGQKRYTVEEIHKHGMLFGYKVFDNKEGKYLPYEYGDDEKDKAETRAELSNALVELE